MTVGLVVVSHSVGLADGVRELAAQMAPDVSIAAAGGSEDGGIGTSFDLVSAALAEADTGDGVVVLYDLGSALLTTETALEFLEPDQAERVLVVDAPLVEGCVAAAVTAQSGGDRHAVAAAARDAGASWSATPAATSAAGSTTAPESSTQPASAPGDPGPIAPAAGSGAEQSAGPASRSVPAPGVPDVGSTARARATAMVADRIGIHARPAAILTRELHRWPDADVRIGRPGAEPVDAGSVLMLIGLGVRQGETVEITGTGEGAEEAVRRIAELIGAGLD